MSTSSATATPPSPAPVSATAPAPVSATVPPIRNRRRAIAIGLLLAVFAAIGIAWGAHWFFVGRFHLETDDAYVQGNIVQITPQVGGTATEVLAEDTQFVEAGQPLVRLDPADAQVALEQAKAQLAQTVREVRVTFSNNGALAAAIEAREADVKRYAAEGERARADLERALADLRRRRALGPIGAVSGEELQHARSAVANARAAQAGAEAAGAAARSARDGAREALVTNQALTDGTTIESHPNVQLAAARVREAMLAVDRLTITAPVSGYVARKSVQVGQRIAAGTPLMAVAPLDQVWVDANFKESQLGHMRIGQPVELVADAYGKRVTYGGRITGLSAGTGAAFAILPAQNATGNWIKIVQRLPVRVALDPEQIRTHPLRIGLSMVARGSTPTIRAGAMSPRAATRRRPVAAQRSRRRARSRPRRHRRDRQDRGRHRPRPRRARPRQQRRRVRPPCRPCHRPKKSSS
jgi:membrane fusion protein (multidrug efflux system)